MSTLLSLIADTGHDQLWLLLAAQRMGPHLNPYGATVFESNPPLAIWLSALVVHAAALLHLSLSVTLKLGVTLVGAGSAAICATLLRPTVTGKQLWLLGIAFLLIFGAVPVRDFGQRDHILALLVLPYLVAAAGRSVPISSRMVITLTAALGVALKPHQALIPIAVELTLLLKLRRPRLVEPAAFLAVAAAYLIAIYGLAPTYLSQILPVLRDTYWAFGHLSIIECLQTSIGLDVLLATAIATYLCRWHQSPILLVAGMAATVAYVAQGTGWYYQQLPAITFLSLAIVVQLSKDLGAPYLAFETWVPRLPIPLAALTLLAFALTIHFSDFHVTSRGLEQTQSTPDPSFFDGLAPGTAVATLTTSVDDTVPPAFRFHLVLAQRYPHLWMLPAILSNESGPRPGHAIPPDRLAELDRLQHRFMVEDLTRWHPALILVQRCQDPAVQCQVLKGRHDDLLAFFLRDPAFEALFRQYRFLRSSGPYDAYALN